MFLKKKTIFMLLTAASVIVFGGFFAYNVYGFIVGRQHAQAANEVAEQARTIFRDWQENQQPPAEPARVPDLDAAHSEASYTNPAPPPPPSPPNDPIYEPENLLDIDEDFEYIRSYLHTLMQSLRQETENTDIIAFIDIPGTNIQYAVVQARDNDFYLYNDIFMQRNVEGSIFMDYRNNPDFSDPNTIIYGHHLRSRAKFSNLHRFHNEDFFHENRYIRIYTDNALYKYEIFAAFVMHISFRVHQVEFMDNEFGEFVNELLNRSNFDAGVQVTQYDNILVLVTCTTVEMDDRWVVAARRMG
jgi:sortase B